MCYHTSLNVKQAALEIRYQAQIPESKRLDPFIHANAYAVPIGPLVTAQQPDTFAMQIWGMIPGWTKTVQDPIKLRTMIINCRYETMY